MTEQVRPNLMALLSVVLGALGVATLCLPIAQPLFGVLGLAAALGAKNQVEETGYGANYAWWGGVLGAGNTVVGVCTSLTWGSLWMT